MNISSEISTAHGFNSSEDLFLNDTKVKNVEVLANVYAVFILFGLPPNSYVIWLIVRGTGNGLASEFFILNLCVFEIVLVVEYLLISLAYKFERIWTLVGFVDGLVIAGRPLFQSLICVERYLAVVHPVTFLKYKPLRYRVISAVVVWVAAFVSAGGDAVIWLFVYKLYLPYFIALFFIFIFFQLFCCLAVLRALKQSGPGERGREREEENHMKRRAFYIILITTVIAVVIYMPYTILLFIPDLINVDMYNVNMCVAQFCYILAGLVEPALFLYRVGKLNFTVFK